MASLYKSTGDILGAYLQYKGVNPKSEISFFQIHLILHAYVKIIPPSAAQSSKLILLFFYKDSRILSRKKILLFTYNYTLGSLIQYCNNMRTMVALLHTHTTCHITMSDTSVLFCSSFNFDTQKQSIQFNNKQTNVLSVSLQ